MTRLGQPLVRSSGAVAMMSSECTRDRSLRAGCADPAVLMTPTSRHLLQVPVSKLQCTGFTLVALLMMTMWTSLRAVICAPSTV